MLTYSRPRSILSQAMSITLSFIEFIESKQYTFAIVFHNMTTSLFFLFSPPLGLRYLDKFEGTIQSKTHIDDVNLECLVLFSYNLTQTDVSIGFVEETGSTVEEFQALSATALKDEDEFSERRFFIEV